VPSDVVALIDRMFRWASQPVRPGQSPPQLGAQHTSAVAAVLDAVEHVPDDLLALSGTNYTSLISGLAACRAAVRAWGAGDRVTYLSAVPGFGEQHAVQLIRQALAACPDQFPSPTTTELTFIPDPDLRASIRLDVSAANQDLAEGEWKGAIVLAGSAIEALLLWALQERDKSKPGEVCTAVGALLGQTLHRNPPVLISRASAGTFTSTLRSRLISRSSQTTPLPSCGLRRTSATSFIDELGAVADNQGADRFL
jgi:hypothetical protein